MPTIEANKDRRNKLISEATKLINETGLKTAESRASHKKITDELDIIDGDIAALTHIAERTKPAISLAPMQAPAPVAAPAIIAEPSETRRKRMNGAWRKYLTDGYGGLDGRTAEQRDISTSTDTDGAALVPTTFQGDIDQAVKFYGPVASLVSVSRQTTGAGRKVPVSDDTSASMTYLQETGGTSSLEADPTLFSTLNTGSDTLVSTVLYSKQEAADAEDIGQFLSDIAGIRVGRALETAVTLGQDNTSSHTTLPNTASLLSNVSAGVTNVAITGPSYANLAALKASVNAAYRVGPSHGFMLSQASHDYLVAQVDSTGRPLYKHDPNTGLLMVAGSPVYINTALADYTANSSPVVLFGDYSKAYRLINAGGVRVRILLERYADRLLNAAIISQRVQGVPLVSSAVKSLTTVAS